MVPKNYDRTRPCPGGLAAPGRRARDKDRETEQIISAWEDYCEASTSFCFAPRRSETGWVASETEFIVSICKRLPTNTIDRQRVVAWLGMGGHSLTTWVQRHDWFRGVAVASRLNSQPREELGRQRWPFSSYGIKDALKEAIEDGGARGMEVPGCLPRVGRSR